MIITLLLSVMDLAAQKPKSFIELSAGLNIPVGEFAETTFQRPESGFANNGFSFSLAYDNRLSYNFGLTGALYLSSNSVNQQAYRDEIDADTLDYPLTVTTRNWGTFGLLAGPFLYMPVSKYLSIDVRAMAGFYSAYSPEVIVSGQTTAGENFTLQLLKYNGIGFAMDAGTTLRLRFGGHGYLLIKGDYIYSTANFNDVKWLNRDGMVTTRTFTQNIQTINLMAGVGYAL